MATVSCMRSISNGGGEKILHSFVERSGANPQAGLTKHLRQLYGTAGGGGASGYGVLFSVKTK